MNVLVKKRETQHHEKLQESHNLRKLGYFNLVDELAKTPST